VTAPWVERPALERKEMAHVRRRLIFDCRKWDPQTQDVAVLSPAPLVLRRHAWRELAGTAEALFAESLACEEEILRRPRLLASLGLPRGIVRALAPSPPGVRIMRFDFHPTREGWRLSEVNADVPGGYIEASGFSTLVSEVAPGCVTVGDPAAGIAGALARFVPPGSVVALVHATAYADDAQVMRFLAARLSAAGFRPMPVGPRHVRWEQDGARLACAWSREAVGAVVRFFPAEWLPQLPRGEWRPYFAPSPTLQANPPSALILQSKRFPLLWEQLRSPLPTWRRLLPPTVDPREVRLDDGTWVLKSVLGRVGDGVGVPGITAPERWRKMCRAASFHPRAWVAQRRFESWGRATDGGTDHLCIGVFVIDGRVAGAYGRAAGRALIDAEARDVAVLVEAEAA